MAQNKRMEKKKKMEELKEGSHKLPRQFDNPCLIATMDLIPLIRPFASCSKSYEFKREKCSHKRIQSNFYYIKKCLQCDYSRLFIEAFLASYMYTSHDH